MGRNILAPPVEYQLLNRSLGLTPVHFFSHGSTRMLEAETESGDYWKKCGDEAQAQNVKGIVMMVGPPPDHPVLRCDITWVALADVFRRVGCPLGLSRRQDRSCHKLQPRQEPLPLR